MKHLLTTLFTVVLASSIFGQTSQTYLQEGITKHKNQDLKGAISDYDKAIKADKSNKDAYFNRGTCFLALKNFKPAMADFTKAIEIDAKYVNAYYSRASVFVSQEKYVEALPDLDKTIELKPNTPNALTLRGQIRAQSGNKKGACEDFAKAKEIGDKAADDYLSKFCGNQQQKGESLLLVWPEEENWKLGNSTENDQIAQIELIHSNETLEKWTEFGSMLSIKGVTKTKMDAAMKMMFDQTKENSPKAKLTFIEKNETTEYPWILFTIECPNFKNDKNPESQLWYIVQGKSSLYCNFRAVKKATITADLKEKWIKFFKTGKVVDK
jgi:tetratricopeptide (TPR) repeat protein